MVILMRETSNQAADDANQKLKAKCRLREREIQQKLQHIEKLEKEIKKGKDSIGNLQRDLKIAIDEKKAQALDIIRLKQQIDIQVKERDHL